MSRRGTDSTATSRSLIARVRTRDTAAWDRLVELYAPLVYHYCRRARLSSDDTADVFQEVFQAIYARIESFQRRTATDSFRGWLATITQNKVRDHFRRQSKEPRGVGGSSVQARLQASPAPPPVDEDAKDTPSGEALAHARVLHAALDEIRPHFKDHTWLAFVGTALDGRSPADVGEELGMKPGAVRVAKCRVLQRLRAALGDLEPEAGDG